jgi:hypothetical protein
MLGTAEIVDVKLSRAGFTEQKEMMELVEMTFCLWSEA